MMATLNEIQQTFQFKSVRTFSDDRRKITKKKHELQLESGDYYPPEQHCVVGPLRKARAGRARGWLFCFFFTPLIIKNTKLRVPELQASAFHTATLHNNNYYIGGTQLHKTNILPLHNITILQVDITANTFHISTKYWDFG